MEDKKYIEIIEKLSDDSEVQAMLASQTLLSIYAQLKSQALNNDTVEVIINMLQDDWKKGHFDTSFEEEKEVELTDEKGKGSVEITGNGSGGADPSVKPTEPEVDEFYHLMSSLVAKAKTTGSVRVTKDMKKIIELIENYKGDLQVMLNIQKMLKMKETEKEKQEVLKKFVKKVI